MLCKKRLRYPTKRRWVDLFVFPARWALAESARRYLSLYHSMFCIINSFLCNFYHFCGPNPLQFSNYPMQHWPDEHPNSRNSYHTKLKMKSKIPTSHKLEDEKKWRIKIRIKMNSINFPIFLSFTPLFVEDKKFECVSY